MPQTKVILDESWLRRLLTTGNVQHLHCIEGLPRHATLVGIDLDPKKKELILTYSTRDNVKALTRVLYAAPEPAKEARG